MPRLQFIGSMALGAVALSLPFIAAPQTSFAQTSSSTSLSGLYACEQIAGDAAQLACYRAETAKIRVSLGESMSTEKQSSSPANTPAFNDDFDDKPKAPKSQTMAITAAESFGVSGYIRFTLSNGEVWQQTEAARVRLGRASPDVLVIKKGRIGGYYGKVNDRRPTFRVKRVK